MLCRVGERVYQYLQGSRLSVDSPQWPSGHADQRRQDVLHIGEVAAFTLLSIVFSKGSVRCRASCGVIIASFPSRPVYSTTGTSAEKCWLQYGRLEAKPRTAGNAGIYRTSRRWRCENAGLLYPSHRIHLNIMI